MNIFPVFIGILLCVSECWTQNKLKCGQTPYKHSVVSRIINGDKSTPNSWPWHVGLFFKIFNGYSFFCGGSLITRKHVLSAAHCFDQMHPMFEIYIGVGLNNLTKAHPAKNLIKVSRIIKHEKYNQTEFENDIVILELDKNVPLSKKISTICLPRGKNAKSVYNKTLFVAGWGSTTQKVSLASRSDTLNEIQMHIINNVNQTLCANMADSRYCAINRAKKNSNLCVGDSGGSLVHSDNGRWFVFGIVSFGNVDLVDGGKSVKCLTDSPTFFTIVPNYINWIDQHVNKKKKLKKNLN
ncbi:serine protease 27-like [Brachionus plicatilis]|uniref:Serine protease 27-like n=1 Tax=Brachionus plicatilis TaxID=10195 RepID=A0A3M7RN04_BRAPC|nr:serine protease 27-like [Brachionus plicatilis]